MTVSFLVLPGKRGALNSLLFQSGHAVTQFYLFRIASQHCPSISSYKTILCALWFTVVSYESTLLAVKTNFIRIVNSPRFLKFLQWPGPQVFCAVNWNAEKALGTSYGSARKSLELRYCGREAANKAFDCNIVAFFHKAISTSSFTASGFGPCHTTPVVSRSILSYCHVHVNRCTKKKK